MSSWILFEAMTELSEGASCSLQLEATCTKSLSVAYRRWWGDDSGMEGSPAPRAVNAPDEDEQTG